MPAKTPLEVRLMRLLRGTIGCLMLLAVSLNCANVVGRYVFLKPFVWAEEMMQFMHLWIVMRGIQIESIHNFDLLHVAGLSREPALVLQVRFECFAERTATGSRMRWSTFRAALHSPRVQAIRTRFSS